MQGLVEQEVVLEQRPLQLLIKLKSPTGNLKSAYGDGVYCMKPRIRVWSRDNAGYAKAQEDWNSWSYGILNQERKTKSKHSIDVFFKFVLILGSKSEVSVKFPSSNKSTHSG